MVLLLIISAVLSYLIGSVNTSIIVSKLIGKTDIRNHGSGNAGATNTLRVLGKKAALFVVIGDGLKGVISILLVRGICRALNIDSAIPVYFAGVSAILGHNFPVFFGFKGGKGILTSLFIVLMIDWRIGLLILAIAVGIIAATRFVSLGSCVGSALFLVFALIFHWGDMWFIGFAIIMSVMAIIKHRTNIVRLMNGTESKIKF